MDETTCRASALWEDIRSDGFFDIGGGGTGDTDEGGCDKARRESVYLHCNKYFLVQLPMGFSCLPKNAMRLYHERVNLKMRISGRIYNDRSLYCIIRNDARTHTD